MPATTFVEFPKWLHRRGKKDVRVLDATEEADVLARWDAEDAEPAPVRSNPLTSAAPVVAAPAVPPPDFEYDTGRVIEDDTFNGADPTKFDHDGDGKPGGSRKGGWPKGKPRNPQPSAA